MRGTAGLVNFSASVSGKLRLPEGLDDISRNVTHGICDEPTNESGSWLAVMTAQPS